MKTYFQNGTSKDIPHFIAEESSFYVQELDSHCVDRYVYSGDNIKYEIDTEFVNLYDKFRDLYFPDTDAYYREIYSLPIFVQEAGQNSDCSLSADLFIKFKDATLTYIPNLNRHLYLVDCQFLIGAIQNLSETISNCLCDFYVSLSAIEILPQNNFDNTVITISSHESRHLCSLIETYFTKAYSILDIFCKIAYELENPMQDFSKYKKMNCADILWGDRKHLKINKEVGTIFEDNIMLRMIEAIRNEVVHNGTWELSPKTFVSIKNGEIEERFVLFPDFDQGRLSTVKNRKHFFSSGTKVNDILPQIHREFLQLVLNTTKYLNGIQFESMDSN